MIAPFHEQCLLLNCIILCLCPSVSLSFVLGLTGTKIMAKWFIFCEANISEFRVVFRVEHEIKCKSVFAELD